MMSPGCGGREPVAGKNVVNQLVSMVLMESRGTRNSAAKPCGRAPVFESHTMAGLTDPSNNPAIVWDSKTGARPHGFAAEFRVPLDSINTMDTSWFTTFFPATGSRPPQPGDIIGFNVAVGDDDNGGLSYL